MLVIKGVVGGILLFLGRELNFLFAGAMAAISLTDSRTETAAFIERGPVENPPARLKGGRKITALVQRISKTRDDKSCQQNAKQHQGESSRTIRDSGCHGQARKYAEGRPGCANRCSLQARNSPPQSRNESFSHHHPGASRHHSSWHQYLAQDRENRKLESPAVENPKVENLNWTSRLEVASPI